MPDGTKLSVIKQYMAKIYYVTFFLDMATLTL